jgi:hypothetical protein
VISNTKKEQLGIAYWKNPHVARQTADNYTALPADIVHDWSYQFAYHLGRIAGSYVM